MWFDNEYRQRLENVREMVVQASHPESWLNLGFPAIVVLQSLSSNPATEPVAADMHAITNYAIHDELNTAKLPGNIPFISRLLIQFLTQSIRETISQERSNQAGTLTFQSTGMLGLTTERTIRPYQEKGYPALQVQLPEDLTKIHARAKAEDKKAHSWWWQALYVMQRMFRQKPSNQIPTLVLTPEMMPQAKSHIQAKLKSEYERLSKVMHKG